MGIIRCEEGFHLYDNQKHSSCPYCRNAGHSSMNASEPGQTRPAQNISTRAANVNQSAPPPAPPSGGGPKTRSANSPAPGSGPAMTKAVWNLKPRTGGPGGAAEPIQVDPVVGWLVCTKGANFGRDYRLRAGLNNIGRGASMDVAISGDEKLSRENHASIAYDPENNLYFLVHGGGRNLTYVNGVPALSQIQLKAGDTIKFGDSEMIFVPLCNDEFTWDL